MDTCTVPNVYETTFDTKPKQTIKLDLASLAAEALELLSSVSWGTCDRERARHRVAVKRGLRKLAKAAPVAD